MKNSVVHGHEGESGKLFLYRRDVLFATAEYFTALIEELSDSSGVITTGYQIRLILNGITIIDETGAKEMLHDMQAREGGVAFDFEGIMKSPNGHRERIIFRQCIPLGAIDIPGLTDGFMDSMVLTVNEVPEKTQKSLGMQ
jgi:hypothetical protein